MNTPTHSVLLKQMMDRIYRTNIQTTNLHSKLVDPSGLNCTDKIG